MMQIRQLTKADAEIFWKFRLLALESEPKAFGESAAEHRRQTVESFAHRLGGDPDSFVLGAFEDSALVGTAGFFRKPREKERHTGHVWGVFVAVSHRGRKVGRALLSAIIERARSLPGIEKLQLTVSVSQPTARKLYASLGFLTYGVDPRALHIGGEYFDEDLMLLDFTK